MFERDEKYLNSRAKGPCLEQNRKLTLTRSGLADPVMVAERAASQQDLISRCFLKLRKYTGGVSDTLESSEIYTCRENRWKMKKRTTRGTTTINRIKRKNISICPAKKMVGLSSSEPFQNRKQKHKPKT